MSGVDSEQDKQPISSVSDGSDLHSPGKEVSEDQNPPVEEIRGISEKETVSVQGETREEAKDDNSEDKEEQSPVAEVTVNGIDLPVDDQKESEVSDNLGDTSTDKKTSETQQEISDDKHVKSESVEEDAGKENDEHKESEVSVETVAIETKKDQDETSSDVKEPEGSPTTRVAEGSGEQAETTTEVKDDQQEHVDVAMETSIEQGETSAKIEEAKESQEAVTMEENDKQDEVLDGSKDLEQSPVAMEVNGEEAKEVKVEVTVPSEVESTQTESKGEAVEVQVVTTAGEQQNGDQHQNGPSEESGQAAKKAEDHNAVEKRRSVTMDSPEIAKDSDKSEDDKTKKGRSKTVGDIEGSATSPVKEDVAARSMTIWYTDVTDDTPTKENPEEVVSYSTSIVGGVVHRVPITSNSPKGPRKPKEGSPQTTPRKRSVIDTLFGRRKKSKGSPESPPAASSSGKDKDKEHQEKEAEASPSSKDTEIKETPETNPAAPDTSDDTGVKDASEPLEDVANVQPEVKGTSDGAEVKPATEAVVSAEVEDSKDGPETKKESEGKKSTEVGDSSGADANHETESKAAAGEEKETGNVEGKPTAEAESQEDIEETSQAATDAAKEVPVETHDAKEEPVSIESAPSEKGKENVEGPKEEEVENKDSDKEAVKRAHTEPSEEEANSQPSPKKKKTSGIFGGFFARRKSKKTKDLGSASASAEKAEGDKVQEQQDAPPAVESNVTDAGAEKGQEDATSPKSEVTESVTSQAAGQTLETVEEELTDKEKVYGKEAATTATDKLEKGISEEADATLEIKTTNVEDKYDGAEGAVTQIDSVGEKYAESKTEVNDTAAPESVIVAEDKGKDTESKPEDKNKEKGAEKVSSPESEEAKDEISKQPVVLRKEVSASYSPKTRRMQMRISYAERDGEGGKEVEVIGTPEQVSEPASPKGKPDLRVSCRSLGEADHEGWLSKKGGMLFLSSWKRKWVVLKDGKLYYFKTAFDPEAGGIIKMKDVTVAEAPETKKNFCFKCEQPGTKPQIYLFMADSKEEMDNWLRVLATASKGEIIQKMSKQNQLSVKDEVVMRRKSGTNSAQRHSSVLAVGGRHDFLEDVEDFKTTRRRSMPGSFSKEILKETEEKGKETVVPNVTVPESLEEQPKDEPSGAITTVNADKPSTPSEAPSDALTAPSDAPVSPNIDAPTAPSDEPLPPSDAPPKTNDTTLAPNSDSPTAPGNTPLAPDSDASTTPSDAPLAPSDTAPTPSDAPLAPSDTDLTLSDAPDTTPTSIDDQETQSSDAPPAPGESTQVPIKEQTVLVVAPSLSESTEDSQEEKPASEEFKTTKHTVSVMVDKVFVGSERVIVETTSSVEASSSDVETPMLPSSGDVVPKKDRGTEESSKISAEVAEKTEKQELSTEAESAVDRADGAVSVTTTKNTVTVVETVKSSIKISETVKTSTAVSTSEKVEQSSQQTSEPEIMEEVTPSEASSAEQLESEPSVTPPLSPSKTKWYFSLDRKQAWSVAPEADEEKSPKRRKSSDRSSIKSTNSGRESISSLPEEDQFMVMCRNIRKARLSIYGEPVVDGAERLRAFSNAKEDDKTLLRLRTLERTLKDKEKHLSDLEELLSQPQINRRSIYEWKLRNSELLDELFPQENIEKLEEFESIAEGGEDEGQKQENVGVEGGKSQQDGSVQEEEETLDKAKEVESTSKDESSENVSEKQSVEEGEKEIKELQKSADDDQQSAEKQLDKENETLTETQQNPSESLPRADSENIQGQDSVGEKQEQEKDIAAEEQQKGEDKLDTHL